MNKKISNNMNSNLENIKKDLLKHRDVPKENTKRFFKTNKGDYAEHDEFLGIKNPTLRMLAKKYYHLSLDEIQKLIESKYNEERLLALIILTQSYKKAPEHEKKIIFEFYLANIDYVNNWNLVDLSAHLIIGAHLFKQKRDLLYKLVSSKIMWHRRIAIVSTLYFIRSNEFNETLSLAKILFSDKHDLIHKATGWMLREVYKKNPSLIKNFLSENLETIPRTALRYAIEKLPNSEREFYLVKNK